MIISLICKTINYPLSSNEGTSVSTLNRRSSDLVPKMGLWESKPTFIALYDFSPKKGSKFLTLKKGDRLTIQDDMSESIWWACHEGKIDKGLVAHNYVAKEGSLESEP